MVRWPCDVVLVEIERNIHPSTVQTQMAENVRMPEVEQERELTTGRSLFCSRVYYEDFKKRKKHETRIHKTVRDSSAGVDPSHK